MANRLSARPAGIPAGGRRTPVRFINLWMERPIPDAQSGECPRRVQPYGPGLRSSQVHQSPGPSAPAGRHSRLKWRVNIWRSRARIPAKAIVIASSWSTTEKLPRKPHRHVAPGKGQSSFWTFASLALELGSVGHDIPIHFRRPRTRRPNSLTCRHLTPWIAEISRGLEW